MAIAVYIVFFIIGIYSLIILLFSIGWIKLKAFQNTSLSNTIPVSIIIACRNEEENISSLIKSLINQTFPKEKTEIIIVDDHSEDNTARILNNLIQDYNHIRLIRLPEKLRGKKNGIAYGIENSTSNIIITTDADCIMSPNWLSALVKYYVQFKPQLLAGPVAIKPGNKLFRKFQALEFLSLIGSGAGSIGINHAIMNNGANLLFEKKAFLNSDQQTHYTSGDDIFLMLDIKKKNSKRIHFIKSKEAVVYTKATGSIHDFFNQRIRWASKSKAYRDFDIIFTALTVFSTNIILVLCLFFSFGFPSFLMIFVTLFIIKSVVDLTTLIPVSKFFHQQKLLWLFLPLQIIYPFYIIFTAILGLIGNFKWKGRSFKEKR